jgi:hypothetical protein
MRKIVLKYNLEEYVGFEITNDHLDSIYKNRLTNAVMNILLYNLEPKIVKNYFKIFFLKIVIFMTEICWSGNKVGHSVLS